MVKGYFQRLILEEMQKANLQLDKFVTGFAKTLHLHTSNFLTLAIHNFESRKAIVLKFSNIINQC